MVRSCRFHEVFSLASFAPASAAANLSAQLFVAPVAGFVLGSGPRDSACERSLPPSAPAGHCCILPGGRRTNRHANGESAGPPRIASRFAQRRLNATTCRQIDDRRTEPAANDHRAIRFGHRVSALLPDLSCTCHRQEQNRHWFET
jgi:hypothetical protein